VKHSAIKSSNIQTVGYDPESQTLEVKFHGGAVHSYTGVPPAKHLAFVSAPSPGAYLHTHIKPVHPAKKLS
jgi:hypothetical protein